MSSRSNLRGWEEDIVSWLLMHYEADEYGYVVVQEIFAKITANFGENTQKCMSSLVRVAFPHLIKVKVTRQNKSRYMYKGIKEIRPASSFDSQGSEQIVAPQVRQRCVKSYIADITARAEQKKHWVLSHYFQDENSYVPVDDLTKKFQDIFGEAGPKEVTATLRLVFPQIRRTEIRLNKAMTSVYKGIREIRPSSSTKSDDAQADKSGSKTLTIPKKSSNYTPCANTESWIQWMVATYEANEYSHVSVRDVIKRFVQRFGEVSPRLISSTMRTAFPNIRRARVGSEGSRKYVYRGICVKLGQDFVVPTFPKPSSSASSSSSSGASTSVGGDLQHAEVYTEIPNQADKKEGREGFQTPDVNGGLSLNKTSIKGLIKESIKLRSLVPKSVPPTDSNTATTSSSCIQTTVKLIGKEPKTITVQLPQRDGKDTSGKRETGGIVERAHQRLDGLTGCVSSAAYLADKVTRSSLLTIPPHYITDIDGASRGTKRLFHDSESSNKLLRTSTTASDVSATRNSSVDSKLAITDVLPAYLISSKTTVRTNIVDDHFASDLKALAASLGKESGAPGNTVNPSLLSQHSKYGELLAVIEELGKDIRPTYAGSKNASERLKKGIMHARALVRECLIETERSARQ